jgi:hypothetical protein
VFYKSLCDIGPDTELMVWYGEDYARELGLTNSTVCSDSLDLNQNGMTINDGLIYVNLLIFWKLESVREARAFVVKEWLFQHVVYRVLH